MLIESRYARARRTGSPPCSGSWSAPVDVLVAAGTTAIQAAQHATTTIPIVMVVAVDAVAKVYRQPRAAWREYHRLDLSAADLPGKELELLIAAGAHGLAGGGPDEPCEHGNVLQVHAVQRAAQRRACSCTCWRRAARMTFSMSLRPAPRGGARTAHPHRRAVAHTSRAMSSPP